MDDQLVAASFDAESVLSLAPVDASQTLVLEELAAIHSLVEAKSRELASKESGMLRWRSKLSAEIGQSQRLLETLSEALLTEAERSLKQRSEIARKRLLELADSVDKKILQGKERQEERKRSESKMRSLEDQVKELKQKVASLKMFNDQLKSDNTLLTSELEKVKETQITFVKEREEQIRLKTKNRTIGVQSEKSINSLVSSERIELFPVKPEISTLSIIPITPIITSTIPTPPPPSLVLRMQKPTILFPEKTTVQAPPLLNTTPATRPYPTPSPLNLIIGKLPPDHPDTVTFLAVGLLLSENMEISNPAVKFIVGALWERLTLTLGLENYSLKNEEFCERGIFGRAKLAILRRRLGLRMDRVFEKQLTDQNSEEISDSSTISPIDIPLEIVGSVTDNSSAHPLILKFFKSECVQIKVGHALGRLLDLEIPGSPEKSRSVLKKQIPVQTDSLLRSRIEILHAICVGREIESVSNPLDASTSRVIVLLSSRVARKFLKNPNFIEFIKNSPVCIEKLLTECLKNRCVHATEVLIEISSKGSCPEIIRSIPKLLAMITNLEHDKRYTAFVLTVKRLLRCSPVY